MSVDVNSLGLLKLCPRTTRNALITHTCNKFVLEHAIIRGHCILSFGLYCANGSVYAVTKMHRTCEIVPSM